MKGVKNGEEVSKEHENNLEFYMPLFDPTKTEVIGTIQIVQDISAVQKINKEIDHFLLVIGIATLLVVLSLPSY